MARTKKSSHSNGKKSNGHRDSIPRAEYAKDLPVRINEAAVAVKAEELAKVIRARDAMLEEKRELNSSYREQIAGYNMQLTELATSVEKHTELRPVKCVERLVVQTNEIEVVRIDTGEIVEKRTATPEDRQEGLFGSGIVEPAKDDEDASNGNVVAAKRGRGRPRKAPTNGSGLMAIPPRGTDTVGVARGRKRGRPRKEPGNVLDLYLGPDGTAPTAAPALPPHEPEVITIKRKRGRPRKHPLPEAMAT